MWGYGDGGHRGQTWGWGTKDHRDRACGIVGMGDRHGDRVHGIVGMGTWGRGAWDIGMGGMGRWGWGTKDHGDRACGIVGMGAMGTRGWGRKRPWGQRMGLWGQLWGRGDGEGGILGLGHMGTPRMGYGVVGMGTRMCGVGHGRSQGQNGWDCGDGCGVGGAERNGGDGVRDRAAGTGRVGMWGRDVEQWGGGLRGGDTELRGRRERTDYGGSG